MGRGKGGVCIIAEGLGREGLGREGLGREGLGREGSGEVREWGGKGVGG